jgi:hypothetical protein
MVVGSRGGGFITLAMVMESTMQIPSNTAVGISISFIFQSPFYHVFMLHRSINVQVLSGTICLDTAVYRC